MSGWGLGYNVMKKEWSKEQLDILGISEKYMPRILKPWDIIGGLTLDYNKARQTQITNELLEITTAMRAME